MFGRKKEEKPSPASAAEPRSVDEKLSAALPQKAAYFNSLRTNAYMNENLVANFVEFWVAMQVDSGQDKWRVMHYMLFGMDQPDGRFKSEVVSKEDISFPQAVYQLSKFEEVSSMMQANKQVDITPEKYPVDKFPELKVYYSDIEYYRTAANIEGIAFDEAGQPYRRVEGKVFSTATFKRSEIGKSILAVEQARQNPVIAAKIEGGILSDIFNSASDRNATLDSILKVGQALVCLDAFAVQIGAVYLGVQRILDRADKFDKLQNLTPEEKKSLYEKSAEAAGYELRYGMTPAALLNLVSRADKQLDDAKAIGIHIEPFKKFVAECELYVHLLSASQSLKKLEGGFGAAGGTDLETIMSIRKSVDAAQNKFVELGGSLEQVDRLKAWVANPKKEEVPSWLPGFIDRYYDQRRKVMQKVQERQAGAPAVNTMSVKVKPPVAE